MIKSILQRKKNVLSALCFKVLLAVLCMAQKIGYTFCMIFRKRKNTLEVRERRAHLIGEAVELYKKNTILIRLNSPADFYNPFDPESEAERELSDEVEA